MLTLEAMHMAGVVHFRVCWQLNKQQQNKTAKEASSDFSF